MVERVYNFSAGPAVLPLPVLEQAQRELLALRGQGISILEISHRNKAFEAILDDSRETLRALWGVPAGYSILFLQGGASLQFSMVPMNLLRGTGRVAEYIVAGSWGTKAAEEARREGDVHVAWDGKASNYSQLPSPVDLKVDPQAAYLHMTSNETIQGVEWTGEPDTGDVPLVCDASSDFLSRPIAMERYGLLYACAQKNAGIAGVTMVIARDDLLERAPKDLPPMLDYRVYAKHGSMSNTPPVFAIYVFLLVARWLRDEVGGLAAMARRNQEKAALLYNVLDRSGGFYRGHARPDCRSMMNVTWRLPNEELENQFTKEAKALGMVDLKGHRSVGGIRASIYNAMPREGVEKLRDFMLDFQKKQG